MDCVSGIYIIVGWSIFSGQTTGSEKGSGIGIDTAGWALAALSAQS
jgi:hypothetical protein